MVFTFSITSSASTASSSKLTFPILSPTDAIIIDEIISKAPSGSSIFSALLEPYQQTLSNHQLDPRLDEKYYSLLLKLSLISGQDWSQKWSKVCEEQALYESTSTAPSNSGQQSLDNVSGLQNHNRNDQSEEEDDEQDEEGDREGTPTIIGPNHSPIIESPSLRRGSLYPNPISDYRNQNSHATVRFQSLPKSFTIPRYTSKLNDPLDTLSDQFRSEHLRSRAFHIWKFRTDRIALALTEVSRARSTLIFSNVWRKWRSKVGKRRREVQLVEGVARTRKRLAILTKWREAAEESRHKRHKRYLIQTLTHHIYNQQHNQVRETYTLWWLKARAKRATRTRVELIKHQALTHWLTRISKLHRANNLADVFLFDIKTKSDTRKMLIRWKIRTRWKLGEKMVIERHQTNLAITMIRKWYQTAIWDRLSKQFLQNSTKRRSMSVWKCRISRLKRLEKRGNRIISIRNENLMGKMFETWKAVERSKLLHRILMTKLLKTCMDCWIEQFDRIRLVLQGARQVYEKKVQRRRLQQILKKWHSKFVHQRQTLLPLSVTQYENKLTKTYLTKWKLIHRKRLDQITLADLTRHRLLRERVLVIWSKRFRRSKILRWIKVRKMNLMNKTFEEWTGKMRRQRWEKVLIANFSTKLDRHRVSLFMNIWLSRVVQLKDREIEVAKGFQTDMVRLRFGVWVKQLTEIKRLQKLAMGFAEIQKIEQRDRMLEFWRVKAIGSKSRKLRLEIWTKAQQADLIEEFWGRWSDALVQKGLLTQEMAVKASNVIQIKHRVIRLWCQNSMTIPSIGFYRERTKSKAWSHWRTLIPIREMRRRAEDMDRKKVLGEAWKVWWSKCTAILASRIVSRFTRPVAFAGGRKRQGASPKFSMPKPQLAISPTFPNGQSRANYATMNAHFSSNSSSSSSSGESVSPTPTIKYVQETTVDDAKVVADESQAEEENEQSIEEEDDRTIVGDVTPIEPGPSDEPIIVETTTRREELDQEGDISTEEEEEGTDEGATESEIEMALEAFGTRNRRRIAAAAAAMNNVQSVPGDEERRGPGVEETRNPLWDGLRRGPGGTPNGLFGIGKLNGISRRWG